MGHCRVHVVAPRFRAFTAAPRCTAGSRRAPAASRTRAFAIATELWAAGSCGVNASSSRLQPAAALSSWRPSSFPLAIRLRTHHGASAPAGCEPLHAAFASPSTLSCRPLSPRARVQPQPRRQQLQGHVAAAVELWSAECRGQPPLSPVRRLDHSICFHYGL
eukprot:7386475-Prymnesium_polylepis.1